jgi:lysozyme family protein
MAYLIDYVQEWEPKIDKKALDEARRTLQADKIFDERVRAKVVDMYLDMGREGIRLVQMAVGILQDGGMGDQTLVLINSASPERLLWRLANISLSYYSTREGSADQHKQWERRARSLGVVGVNMTLGQGDPKTNEQVSVPEQHGGWPGAGAALEGERPSGSRVDQGQKSKA